MSGIIHPTTTSNIGFGFGSTNFEFYDDRSWHGDFYPNFHGGIDYWGPLGYPIWATANGTVLYAGFAVPYIGSAGGNGVVISHGEYLKSIYGHMDTVIVSQGQQVIAGQKIGTMGQSGLANGVNHLHFEIRTITPEWGEDVENPAALMDGGSLVASGFAWQTEDIPWVEPMGGTTIHMGLCQRMSNGNYALPTAASRVDVVYYDRLRVSDNDYNVITQGENFYINPHAVLNEEVEVRCDYVT